MSEHNWMEFTRFVPGFDFLRNLVPPGLAGVPSAAPAASSAQNVFQQWLAPTMDEAEVQKRIDELKVVQFWLEQNGRALQATIQALEVQKMTLSALKTMGQGAQEMAQAFSDGLRAPQAEQASASPRPAPPQADTAAGAAGRAAAQEEEGAGEPMASIPGVSEMQHMQGQALQWWGALTEQFQSIAAKALEDIGHQMAAQPMMGTQKAEDEASARADAQVQTGRQTAVRQPAGRARKTPTAPRAAERAAKRAKSPSAAPKTPSKSQTTKAGAAPVKKATGQPRKRP